MCHVFVLFFMCSLFFFFKQKTAYEMRISDWSSDVCSSDLQQILLRPAEYDVIATLNLNGDYVSDALAAQVGGIGIAPGANLSDSVAMFEATHGTAPKYAGKDYVRSEEHTSELQSLMRISYAVFCLKKKTKKKKQPKHKKYSHNIKS